MITFICLFFPPVLSVWIYEHLRRRDLRKRHWIYLYAAAVLTTNLCVFLVKRLVLGTGGMPIFDLYNDLPPSAASNYLIMAVPCALVFGAGIYFLQARGRQFLRALWHFFSRDIKLRAEPHRSSKRGVIASALTAVVLAVSTVCWFSARWYAETYGTIGFDSILYTLLANLGGVQSDLVRSYLRQALLPSLAVTAAVCLLVLMPLNRKVSLWIGSKQIRLYPLVRRLTAVVLCLVLSVGMLVHAAKKVELPEFVDAMIHPSTLFQDRYLDPDTVSITFPEQKRNLIYIILESMETTFLSEELGGALPDNVIPELYELALENTNFSHNDGVGGFGTFHGTSWTSGALVAQTAGIPLKTPVDAQNNSYGTDGVFLPGVTSLTNILRENGYYQMVMFGSDAAFGGREAYYLTHGVDEILDHGSAMEDGIIPQGYHAWWGMEDLYLYRYAKQELLELAQTNQPFAFTMLTADTHHINGYLCSLCGNEYAEQYENVYRCASRQAAEFVKWLQDQPFYENTTVIIVGDHFSMDGAYVSRNVPSDYYRPTYNCILNAPITAENTKNRDFTAMDLFPTTLAALGCRIEGERLGLGTNLFSDVPTLAEELGRAEFDAEASKYSSFYIENFH